MTDENEKTTAHLRDVFRQSGQVGTFMSLIFGLVFGVEIAGMGELLPYPKDSFLFIFYVSVIFWVLGTLFVVLVGLMYHLFCALVGRTTKLASIQKFLISTSLWALLLSQGMLIFVEFNRPVFIPSKLLLIGFVIIAAIAVFVAMLVGKIITSALSKSPLSQRKRLWQKLIIVIPAYFIVLVISLLVISKFMSRTLVVESLPEIAKPESKILLIGIDAANWTLVQPLAEQGKLPNISRLIDEGASGSLPSLVSMYNPIANTITRGIKSAAVWTSIHTGKSPRKHGIKDFIYTDIPGIRHPFRYPLVPSFMPAGKKIEKILGLNYRPYYRGLLKSKPAWKIYSDLGFDVAALGWWETWPAEDVNGEILTDRFDNAELPSRWSPSSLISTAEIESLVRQMNKPDSSELSRFTSFPYQPQYKEKFEKNSHAYILNELVKNLTKSYYQDKFRSDLGQKLMRNNQYTFMAVYFYGTDTATHAFWRFMEPELFDDVHSDEINYFGKTIENYYEFVDTEVGKFLNLIDKNTTVVIVSDHGMGPWNEGRLSQESVRLSGNHREKGIVILWGEHIRRGVHIRPKNVLDILPTELYLSGLPIAKDLDGHVITEAIDPEVMASRPIEYIATYETAPYQYIELPDVSSDVSIDKEQMERLKALGYVK